MHRAMVSYLISMLTGQSRHIFYSDAVNLTAGAEGSVGVTTGVESGGLFVLRGDEKGIYPYSEISGGIGSIHGSFALKGMLLYYDGSVEDIKSDMFYGLKFAEYSAGGELAAYLGVMAVPSNFGNDAHTIFGIGISAGFGTVRPFCQGVS